MKSDLAIVWIRNDFRLNDNPALFYACKEKWCVVPVFILDPADETGAASRVWLHQTILSFQKQLQGLGSNLHLRSGDPVKILSSLVQELKATAILFNRRYEPYGMAKDKKVALALSKLKLKIIDLPGNLILEPEQIQTKGGGSYRLFTPFYNCFLDSRDKIPPCPAVKRLHSPEAWPKSTPIGDLKLKPDHSWPRKTLSHWMPGELGAQQALQSFWTDRLSDYDKWRDFPYHNSTSRLSPYLHFGELSSREVWQHASSKRLTKPTKAFLRQLVWREFSQHFLVHNQSLAENNLLSTFDRFPWRTSKPDLQAWKKGETGYPFIDAGMKELWETGWMHNRARMATASFLVKDLRIHWIEGANWFMNTLFDADIANNSLGWQWVAGTSPGASPFFRVFNPVLQSKRFDPDGQYIRKWVPKLKSYGANEIHEPWKHGGSTPIVDHKTARDAALTAYHQLKR